MEIWYFYGQYKGNSLETNEKSYNIFDLHHTRKVAAHFQKKNKTVMCVCFFFFRMSQIVIFY